MAIPTLDKLPQKITAASVWYGDELQTQETRWRWHLSQDDIAELASATDNWLSSGQPIAALTKEAFELPRLANKLAKLCDELRQGLGFQVIRGLPVANYAPEFIAVLFAGIGLHIGNLRSQNAAGHLLGHVRDTGADANNPATRIYQTAARQTFHTDSADVVGLLCLQRAKQGGESLLLSSTALYNDLRQQSPTLCEALFQPIATDRRGEVDGEQAPYFVIPVFNWHQGLLNCIYQRQYIDSAQRFADAPRLSAPQRAALDEFDRLCEQPHRQLAMQLEPGDMQFVYNHALLHDRRGFSDHQDPNKRRHLLRLWLALDDDRQLPPCYAERYGNLQVGARGGVNSADGKLRFALW